MLGWGFGVWIVYVIVDNCGVCFCSINCVVGDLFWIVWYVR